MVTSTGSVVPLREGGTDVLYYFKKQQYPKPGVSEKTAIVMDNGTYHCRMGWAVEKEPTLIARSLTSRGKFGLVIGDIRDDFGKNPSVRSPFDQNIVTSFDVTETMFDHMFEALGINTETVQHPILVTEALCNPNYSRKKMSELLFECYGVPSLTSGIDAVFSYYENSRKGNRVSLGDGIILSSGYTSSHTIPILDGKISFGGAKRMDVGGLHGDMYLYKGLATRFPEHAKTFLYSRCKNIKEDHMYTALNFQEELNALATDTHDNTVTIQLPIPLKEIQGEENRETEEARAKRYEASAQRFREQQKKKRHEKILKLETEMAGLEDLQQDQEKEDFADIILEYGFKDVASFQKKLRDTKENLEKLYAKDRGEEWVKEDEDEAEKTDEELFPLLFVNPESITEDQVAELQKQRMLKRFRDGRLRQKKIREEEQRVLQELKEAEDARREAEPEVWLNEQKEALAKIRTKIEKNRQQRTQLGDRRSAAAQSRMRMIASLAEEEKDTKKGRKRKKEDDGFGDGEKDWDVYKTITNETIDEELEDLNEQRMAVEQKILEHFPNEARDIGIVEEVQLTLEERFRIDLAVDRIRVPEIVFQPNIIGEDQCGIAECVELVVRTYDAEERARMQKNVFITGGNTCFPNFRERVDREIRMMTPFQSEYNVSIAKDPVLDAWRGAAAFAQTDEFSKCLVTKKEWDECGAEYLKEHHFSNKYFVPPPPPVEEEEAQS